MMIEYTPGSNEEIVKLIVSSFLRQLGLDRSRDDIKKIIRVYTRMIFFMSSRDLSNPVISRSSIGKRSTPRPLLVKLSTGMLKNHTMETTFKFKAVEKFKRVIISHNMTKLNEIKHKQFKQNKQLLVEAKEPESNDPSGSGNTFSGSGDQQKR